MSSSGLSNNFLVKYEKNKAALESNLNLVDFCTDKCLEKNYSNYKFTDNQLSCVKTCFLKISNVEKLINNSN